MSSPERDAVEFDEIVAVALAEASVGDAPGLHVRRRLMARLEADTPPLPAGFAVSRASRGWVDHPVPGIRMKVLSIASDRRYATLLLDVAPGTRFPAHHHTGAEECYVISGSVMSYGRRLGPGDFLHADAETDHAELSTDEGAQVLLVVPPEDYMVAAFG